MSSIPVSIRRLDHAKDLPLPAKQTADAAGFDLCAAVDAPVTIESMRIAMIPCGFAMQLPPGYEAQIRPRSGLSSRHGVTLINCVGTIDADYRGEVTVPLINLGRQAHVVRRGDRIAQMIVAPVPPVTLVEVDSLDETARGAGGFGHTGFTSKPE
jgi:dUTP pyrophosphatase